MAMLVLLKHFTFAAANGGSFTSDWVRVPEENQHWQLVFEIHSRISTTAGSGQLETTWNTAQKTTIGSAANLATLGLAPQDITSGKRPNTLVASSDFDCARLRINLQRAPDNNCRRSHSAWPVAQADFRCGKLRQEAPSAYADGSPEDVRGWEPVRGVQCGDVVRAGLAPDLVCSLQMGASDARCGRTSSEQTRYADGSKAGTAGEYCGAGDPTVYVESDPNCGARVTPRGGIEGDPSCVTGSLLSPDGRCAKPFPTGFVDYPDAPPEPVSPIPPYDPGSPDGPVGSPDGDSYCGSSATPESDTGSGRIPAGDEAVRTLGRAPPHVVPPLDPAGGRGHGAPALRSAVSETGREPASGVEGVARIQPAERPSGPPASHQAGPSSTAGEDLSNV